MIDLYDDEDKAAILARFKEEVASLATNLGAILYDRSKAAAMDARSAEPLCKVHMSVETD